MSVAHQITRLELTRPLSEHDQAAASTLTDLQIFPDPRDTSLVPIIAAAEIGVGKDIPAQVDVVRGNATAGAFNVTLPPGSLDIIGHIYEALKTDVSANAFGFVRQGTDAFEDAATSYTNTTQHASVRTYWDGAVWRKVAGATGGVVPPASSSTLGDGTGSPTLTMNKSAAGTDTIVMQAAGVRRGQVQLDGSENLIISTYASDGTTVTGSITISQTNGQIVIPIATVVAYADDAAAAVGLVPVGGLYRTASAIKIRAA